MTVLLRLPKEMRSELKKPLGDVSPEVDDKRLASAARVVAVGDMVTYHLLNADVEPDVAVVDGRTEREDVADEVVERWRALPVAGRAENPAGTVTQELIEALRTAYDTEGDNGVLIEVEGEEDLAALPAIALADNGDIVLYGQPQEGMVYVEVDDEVRDGVLNLLRRMDGDTDALDAALGLRNS